MASRQLRNFGERLVEGLLTLSGSFTSLTILLIVVFLFKEGAGLFSSPSVESGYTLVVHPSNPISSLDPTTIKKIFDEEITSWHQIPAYGLTNPASPIHTFRFDEIFSLYSDTELGGDDYPLLSDKLSSVVYNDPSIIAFLPQRFLIKDFRTKHLPTPSISLSHFFLGSQWLPTATPSPLFGLLPLIAGTLWVSFFAILIALPFGVGVAVYLSELAGDKTRKTLKPAIELLAGIPSVVYGFFGLVALVPLIQHTFNLPVGETALAGALVLAIMALPTIITIAEDSLRTVPNIMRESSLALGASRWQTIYRVVVPCAASGITAAVVLGIGRAVGETMAVLMVTGNAAIIPTSLTDSVRTIPATIAAELGEAPTAGAHYQALFMLGCILFLLTMLISLAAELITKRQLTHKGI
ncbi:MAG: phosphate ABC transporter permease subunit PstC [Tannerellaceae bacterium]|jgi:phosphate transport system permease protein|nr:phosphate ABC transporter permease subunit PstC [Tannerellaceae bacterium]